MSDKKLPLIARNLALFCPAYSWHVYDMVTQNMLRAHEEKKGVSEKKICDYYRSNRMPSSDQITDIAPYVRAYILATI